MKINLLKTILIIGIFTIFGASALNAQTNLNGRYIYEVKNDKESSSFILTFERKDAIYYSYFYEGAGTIGGKWTIENGIIKAVLTRGDESWTLKLKRTGDDLEIAETLPEKGLSDIPDFKTILSAGAVFKKDVSKPTGPDLTPEEIGKRVLKLVKSVRTIKDISPENIERQTGVKVAFHEQDRSEYGFGGNVSGASDWTYGFHAYPYPSKDNKKTDTLRFSFDYQLHEPLNPDMTNICKAFDFDSFSRELQKAGFSAPRKRYGVHGMFSGWDFSRLGISVSVSAAGENCLNMIVVSVNDL